ncbi:putative acyl-CoA dehydrogenase fadE25 [Halioglobus japonicus]|nr:putative acyl-CoA dehydrogenase fadE25 [Halioglobus japonicus]
MNSDNALLIDMVRKLCLELSDTQTQSDSTTGGSTSFTQQWQKVEDFGLPLFLLPEDAGGFGGNWAQAAQLFQLIGEYALPLPIGETIIARRYLHNAQSVAPHRNYESLATDRPLAIAHCSDAVLREGASGYELSGSLRNVAMGSPSDLLISVSIDGDDLLALLPHDTLKNEDACTVTHYNNTAGEQRVRMQCQQLPVTALWRLPSAVNLQVAGALLRCAQMSGAMQSILGSTINYALERKQFGRAIGKFQVIQHDLARLAEEAAATQCAALHAARAADAEGGPERAEFEIAAAKLRANMAVPLITTIAHQVHGAIGFTIEHPLHRFTQRLFAWRPEFGNDRHWAKTLGDTLRGLNGEALWPFITGRSDRQVAGSLPTQGADTAAHHSEA